MPLPDSCVISEPAIQPTLCSRPRSNFLRGFFINLRLSSLPPFLPTFCLGLQRSLPYHVGWNICLLPYLSESQLRPLCYRRCCCFIPHRRGYLCPFGHCACCSPLKLPFLCFIFSCLFCLLLAPLGLGTKWKQFQDIKLAFWFCLVIHSFENFLLTPYWTQSARIRYISIWRKYFVQSPRK